MNIDARQIRIMLAEQGMTQATLAAKAKISKQNLSRILSKSRCRADTAGKIAGALGAPVASITEES